MGPRATGKKLPVIRALLGVEPPQDASEAPPAGEAPEREASEQPEPVDPAPVLFCLRLIPLFLLGTTAHAGKKNAIVFDARPASFSTTGTASLRTWLGDTMLGMNPCRGRHHA